MTEVSEAFNAFTPGHTDELKAVSFFTATDNVDYTIIIYDTFANGELTDELSSTSGTYAHRGFHTVELPQLIPLTAGDEFYIYVSLSDGGHAYDRTSEVPVLLGDHRRVMVHSAANPGESYYKTDSTWTDLYLFNTTANFCIKGLGIIDAPSIEIGILGGIGLSLMFTNDGRLNITDLHYEVILKGGILGLLNRSITGDITAIDIGQTIQVDIPPFIALGSITITVKALGQEKETEAKQFIIFTQINSD